jgi:hypothetical protein
MLRRVLDGIVVLFGVLLAALFPAVATRILRA